MPSFITFVCYGKDILENVQIHGKYSSPKLIVVSKFQKLLELNGESLGHSKLQAITFSKFRFRKTRINFL